MIPDTEESGIKEETEIREDIYPVMDTDMKAYCLRRGGFTQGSPLSPPMSMLGFDKSGIPELISADFRDDLIMYADDGILVSDTELEQEEFEYL